MKVALSWSGGKDACYTLHKLHEQGIEVVCLLTTIPKELNATFGHGEKREAIEAQGQALGIPVEWISCTFPTYTDDFIAKVKEVRNTYQITAIAYGDLYLDEHREWGEQVAKAAEIEALYPLWMKESDASTALQQFISSGYRAKMIRSMQEHFSKDDLGREINESFYQDLQNQSICPMGEKGEYHTFVYDGPLFQKKVIFTEGAVEELETTWRLHLEDISLMEK
ncbi:diphthine--ammonia ligase [Bacillus massiliigorillae]|uniref:Dph6-related ATP pyrophosphatase n=1 Tax=Bacillus massiliigorillae TaxID=1243664 RepID=UPI0003A078CF|nr:diphthine--ammonia ligase [Bacillus massiliigorillae]